MEGGALQPLPGRFQSTPTEELDMDTGLSSRFHKGQARFWLDLVLPADAPAGLNAVTGSLVYAACDGIICFPERKAPFRAQVRIEPGLPRAEHTLPSR